uniref:Copper transport protein n=1 Tax=Globisporangium ultimum (strain ATCC 200006 / CBS 805.95 / DAOM BR144) TaxID=431595 RepID=K3WM27_GLOUD
MPSRGKLLLLGVYVVALLLSACDAGQNLRKTTCPLCDMDVKADINASIFGNQHVYACEMAGHIDALQNQPKANLGPPVKVDLATDKIYKDATEMECPVCNKKFSELKYAVPWISMGQQKIFTCTEEHANEVYNNPLKYFAASESSGGFCDSGSSSSPRGSVMFDGFQLAFGDDATCALLFFQPWVLSSAVKYAFAFLGIVALSAGLEGLGELREYAQTRFYRDYGIVFSQADYIQLATPSSQGTTRGGSFNKSQFGPDGAQLKIIRRIPFWCKGALAALYMANIAVAYFIMLVVMTYESLMFLAVILGLGIGFFVFKDTEAESMTGNIDPCCST